LKSEKTSESGERLGQIAPLLEKLFVLKVKLFQGREGIGVSYQ